MPVLKIDVPPHFGQENASAPAASFDDQRAEQKRLEAKIRKQDRDIADLHAKLHAALSAPRTGTPNDDPDHAPRKNITDKDDPEQVKRENFQLMASIVDLEMAVSRLQKENSKWRSRADETSARLEEQQQGQQPWKPPSSSTDEHHARELEEQLRAQMTENLQLQRELLDMNATCVKLESEKAAMKASLSEALQARYAETARQIEVGFGFT